MMNEKELDITVCVLSYNRLDYLIEAIESIKNQSCRPKKVIIYDNGSKMDVKLGIEPLLSDSIIWIGSDKEHAVDWNLKRAFRKYSTRYLFVMHDDDRLCPTFLEKQIDFLEEHEKVIAVACNAYRIDRYGDRTGILSQKMEDDEIRYFNSSSDMALFYSSRDFLPFPSIVYRCIDFLDNINWRFIEFGKVLDAIFLCELSNEGQVAYQNVCLFECRVHGDQDSAHIPDQLYSKLDDYYLQQGRSDQKIYGQILRNVERRQTWNFIGKCLQKSLIERSPQKALDYFKCSRPKYFSMIYMMKYFLTFDHD